MTVSSLSGGNQQKVVIGKALMTEPKILLMDEPSRGIDIGAKAEVFRVMRKLAADGLGIVFATSDLEEVMSLSDRILVMSNGRVTGDVRQDEATKAPSSQPRTGRSRPATRPRRWRHTIMTAQTRRATAAPRQQPADPHAARHEAAAPSSR